MIHFRVRGKRGKIRFVPVHAMAQRLIEEYLALAGHGTLQGARGAEVLRVHNLSGIPLEVLLGADGLPAGGRWTVRRDRDRTS